MALSTVEVEVLGIFDKMAYLQEKLDYDTIGGRRMFDRVYDTADEAFILTMAQYAHNADLEMGKESEAGMVPLKMGSYTAAFCERLDYYVRRVLGYATFDAYMVAKRLRMNSQTLTVLGARGGIQPASLGSRAYGDVNAPGLLLGSLIQAGSLTAGSDIDLTACAGSPILAAVTVKGTADWTLSAVLKLWDHTTAVPSTKTVAQVVVGTGTTGVVGDTYVIGRQAISSSAASGQKTVVCSATGQFKVGQKVLLTLFSGDAPNEVWTAQEVATVATINTNTSLVMVDNLLHTYATGWIYPFYTGLTACTGSGGTTADRVNFYPAADRRLRK